MWYIYHSLGHSLQLSHGCNTCALSRQVQLGWQFSFRKEISFAVCGRKCSTSGTSCSPPPQIKNPRTLQTDDVLEATAKRMQPLSGSHFTDKAVRLISCDKVKTNLFPCVIYHRVIKTRVEYGYLRKFLTLVLARGNESEIPKQTIKLHNKTIYSYQNLCEISLLLTKMLPS
jgi:hypothetical protein